jgi:8-oxo-dGTP pyrophosphatase MutT (NUDIX family)
VRGRKELIEELRSYRPFDERERTMVGRLDTFLRSHADCFERRLAVGHVTGSAWVVDRSLRTVLLTHHRKLGKWLQLGGHADGDPDIRSVALREAVEESGLAGIVLAQHAIYDVDVHKIPARSGEPAHLHYDVRFAFFADALRVPRASAESHEVAWVPLEKVEHLSIDDSVRRLVAKTGALATRVDP